MCCIILPYLPIDCMEDMYRTFSVSWSSSCFRVMSNYCSWSSCLLIASALLNMQWCVIALQARHDKGAQGTASSIHTHCDACMLPCMTHYHEAFRSH